LLFLGALALGVLVLGPVLQRNAHRSEWAGVSFTVANPGPVVGTVAKPRPIEVAVALSAFCLIAAMVPYLGAALAHARRRPLGRPPRGVLLRAPPSLLPA
jgi:hypothetical protein